MLSVIEESKENIENLKGMLHHVYNCIRVKRNTSKQSRSLLLATTSFKQQNDEEIDKSAYYPQVGLKEGQSSIYRGCPLLQRQ